MPRETYLIIGNSAAAMGGIAGIREADQSSAITLLAREVHHTYSRPLVSYLLGGKVSEDRMLYRPPDFYDRNCVRAMLGIEAARIDADARAVETADKRVFEFDKLLIATGGRPLMPLDITGTEVKGVFTLTSWNDARNIKAYVEENHVGDALVVGGGMIGIKSVEALVSLKIRTTVVELANRMLSASLDQTASDMARESLEKAGVTVRCKTTVTRILGSDGKVAGAILRDGTLVPCSLVVFAIGVVPDLTIVKNSPIKTDRGILVGSTLETSVPGIYAAGDVAQAPDAVGGEKRCIPILPNAYRQGFVAGANMAGRKKVYKGSMAMNAVDVLGLPTISVGLTDPADGGYEVLSAVDREAPAYRKIVLKDGRIVGAIFVGRIDRAGIVTNLIREKVVVSGFKDLLLSGDFGMISLPAEYRKHMVSGAGIEV